MYTTSPLPLEVRTVDTRSREDLDRFVSFPFRLYQRSHCWVPPLVSSARTEMDPTAHPFYEHSEAAFFIAERGGEMVGRIGALHHRPYNRHRQANAAFFGYFDAIDDTRVARALLAATERWATARGLSVMVGPRTLIGFGGGILVDGFEHPAVLGAPYNFPYYDRLLTEARYEKETDFLSGSLDLSLVDRSRLQRLAQRVAQRRGYWVKTFASRKEMRSWAGRVVAAHHAAFASAHTYVPPTEAEIALVVDTILTVADLKLSKLVMQGDDIVGFVLAYRDLAEAMRKARGRLWPLGWFHLRRALASSPRLNINGIGILPAHQGLGGTALLYAELAADVDRAGIEHIEAIMVEEGNIKSITEQQGLGVRMNKRHRSYQRQLVDLPFHPAPAPSGGPLLTLAPTPT